MSLLTDAKSLLVNATVAGASTIFLGHVPDAPDDCIVLTGYGSRPPVRVMNGGLPVVQYPNLHVMVRRAGATSYVDAEDKCVEIIGVLQGFKGVVSTVRYMDFAMVAVPTSIGHDENRRDRFVVSFNVTTDGL